MSARKNSVADLDIDNGLVALDEHTNVSCMVHDVTATSLNLTLLESSEVPGTFVLLVAGQACVCTVVRRSEEDIEASFTDVATLARAASIALPARCAVAGFGH